MKTQKSKLWAMMLLLAMGSLAPAVNAQDDLLSDTDSVLNSEQIPVDGVYETKPQPTAADRIEKMRKQLEEKNEQMVNKKIEDIRMREEVKLAKKLQKAFQGGLQNLDTVSTVQAAPAIVKVEAPKPVVKKAENKTKVIPTAGILNVTGEGVDFDADVNAGLSIENMVHPRVSVGLGFSMTTMKITDVANTYNTSVYNGYNGIYNYNTYNTYQNGYLSGYQSLYGQGREMSYRRMGVELNSKFFLTVDTTIRPYLGLGVAYNKANLRYEDNQSYSYDTYSFGNEEFSSNYVSGTALVGAEVNFSNTIGMVLDFRYSSALTTGYDKNENLGYATHPDQQRLANVGGRIEDAEHMSLNAGLMIKF
jgi:outer membrane protein W